MMIVGAAACVAIAHWIAIRSAPPRLAEALGVQAPESRVFGVVVLHPDDCASAWRFLELLTRPTVQARMPVVAIVTTSNAVDSAWRERLPVQLRSTHVLPLHRPAAVTLGRLGIQGLPTLLVFRDRLLVGIERAPQTPLDFIALGRRLDPELGRPTSNPSQTDMACSSTRAQL